eukprot:GHVP01010679.1.p1 GENE.GHVP01010679.1~~GHVP01010679.1.p1  ORF type:complete len:620 (+),score=135.48 GHVP01010679.1:159-2018(+)
MVKTVDKLKEPGSTVDAVVLKQKAFLDLKAWENDRNEFFNILWNNLESLYDDLHHELENPKTEMNNISRHLKELCKAQLDFAARQRLAARPSLFSSSIEFSTGSQETSKWKFQSELATDIFFSRQSPKYLEALSHSADRNAHVYEEIAGDIQNDVVQNVLGKCLDSYQRVLTLHMTKLTGARHKLMEKNKETLRYWLEHEKHFKLVEQQEANEKASSGSTSYYVPAEKDCWISERKYKSAATSCQALATEYLGIFRHSLIECHELNEWRKRSIAVVMKKVLRKQKKLLEELARSLGATHAMIDPENFETTHLKISPSADDQRETTTEAAADENKHIEEQTDDAKKKINGFFKDASTFVFLDPIPESELVIKKGIVERQSGFMAKWTAGWLVLTWDKFLHMFRATDDIAPSWTVSLISAEAKREQTDSDLYVIETKEKRPSVIPKKFCFKCLTLQDMNEWLTCIQSAISDRTSNFTFKSKELVDRSEISRIEEHQKSLSEVRERLAAEAHISSDTQGVDDVKIKQFEDSFEEEQLEDTVKELSTESEDYESKGFSDLPQDNEEQHDKDVIVDTEEASIASEGSGVQITTTNDNVENYEMKGIEEAGFINEIKESNEIKEL